jgi:hypothetical protein
VKPIERPGDDCNIDDMAAELIDSGLVLVYEVSGKPYAWIPTFIDHQCINNREAASTLPSPDEGAYMTRAPRVDHVQPTRPLPVKAEGKGREGKGTNTPHTPQGGSAFDTFWTEYPRKENKAYAIKCWQKLQPTEETIAAIMASLAAYKQSEQWLRGIIPHASTWLNQGRWLDELLPHDLPRPGAPPNDGLTDDERRMVEEVARAQELARARHANPTDNGLLGLPLGEGVQAAG